MYDVNEHGHLLQHRNIDIPRYVITLSVTNNNFSKTARTSSTTRKIYSMALRNLRITCQKRRRSMRYLARRATDSDRQIVSCTVHTVNRSRHQTITCHAHFVALQVINKLYRLPILLLPVYHWGNLAIFDAGRSQSCGYIIGPRSVTQNHYRLTVSR